VLARDVIHDRLGVEQRRRVHMGRAPRTGERHGAIGGRVDQAALRGQACQHGQGRGRGKAAQRFGIQLAGQQVGLIALLRRKRAGRIPVERWPHLGGPR